MIVCCTNQPLASHDVMVTHIPWQELMHPGGQGQTSSLATLLRGFQRFSQTTEVPDDGGFISVILAFSSLVKN